MPGIHVPTFANADLCEQEESSIVTVPGSYWLCYKKNIYKFVFKYHPLHRSTEKFTHEKELVNVIRRIIKSNPCQGQHFMTRNLLITCNHGAWTRTDKLYAVMKFQKRTDASTFSHAFFLTVTLTTPPGKKSVSTLATATNKGRESETSTSGFTGQDVKQTGSLEENCSVSLGCDDTTLGNTSLGTNSAEAIGEVDSPNSSDLSSESLKLSKCPKNSSRWFNTEIHDTKQSKHTTRGDYRNLEKNDPSISNEIDKEIAEYHEFKSLSASGREYSSNHASCTHSNTSRESERSCGTIEPAITNYSQAGESSDHREDDKSTSEEVVADSMNLPYQYFIEKDIQKTKSDIMSDRTRRSDSIQFTSRSEVSSESEIDDEREKPSKGENEKTNNDIEARNVPNGIKSRSSDITDLVMGGVMFTIREEKDSVAVIEAKTKFEIDEVLENSEKAETKGGEKCLKNSSLLGLENLITMIEEPEQKSTMHKNFPAESTSPHFDSPNDDSLYHASNDNKSFNWENRDKSSPEPSTSFAHNSINFSTTCSTPDTMRHHESRMPSNSSNTRMECSDNEDDDEYQDDTGEDDEEEDIIPEALLMDNMNTRLCNAEYLASNHKPNLPRVVSNEIITVDQIPLAIQNALKSKLSKQEIQTVTKDQSNKWRLDSQSEDFKKDYSSDSNESRLMKVTEENIENPIKPKSSHLSRNKNVVVEKKDKWSLRSHKQKNSNENAGSRTSIRRKELELHRVSIKELKRLAPKGLQDITQDFYRDVLQMQKRSSSTELRSLRQRKRSTDKDGEIHVEMLKFVRDITMGAKVVIERMSTETISNILRKSNGVTPYSN